MVLGVSTGVQACDVMFSLAQEWAEGDQVHHLVNDNNLDLILMMLDHNINPWALIKFVYKCKCAISKPHSNKSIRKFVNNYMIIYSFDKHRVTSVAVLYPEVQIA